MELDDIIYLSLLIFTIVFGFFFRQLEDKKFKKWISTIVGFLIVLFVSGTHVFHSIFTTIVNGSIIVYANKRYCHTLSFVFSFLYLLFFRTTLYFGIPYPPGHTNLVQMILTLKIVGLAFEVHDSYMQSKDLNKKETDEKNLKLINENAICPNFKDIFHYAYCYIGVLTGPYYSYKTYKDYFENDFYKYAKCNKTTLRKLLIIPFYVFLFLTFSACFPVKYAVSDEFYTKTTFWYRLWYMSPVFVSFRMRIYIGLTLSEAACTMAGLGAYPEVTQPKPGKGPSTNYEHLEKLKKEPNEISKTDFNFETVHNINTWITETNPTVRESIHYWNMCVQYWMVFVVYKRFPYKALRTTATFIVSALWHGIYAGYYLCLCSVPFYLPIEDIWQKLVRKDATGKTRMAINFVFWIIRSQAFTYMGMAFSLLSLKSGLRYYGSIYYVYHVTSFIALIIGLICMKFKKRRQRIPDDLKKK